MRHNRGTASATILWETLKAFLRGLIREITGVKSRSTEWEDTVRGEMQHRKTDRVANLTPSAHKLWLETQALYNSVVQSAAEKKRYFILRRERTRAICWLWWLGHSKR